MMQKVFMLFFVIFILFSFSQKSFAADFVYWEGDCFYIEVRELIKNLTENKARQVIQEEARKAGIELTFLHSVTYDEYLFFCRLDSMTFEMFYYNFMLMDVINRFAVNYSEIPDLIQLYKKDNVFYPIQLLESPLNKGSTSKWQPNSTKLEYAIDAINTELKIACAYLSQEEYETFLYGSPEELGDVLKSQLQKGFSSYFFGLFTAQDENTLRFQCRCFFAWWNYQMKLRYH